MRLANGDILRRDLIAWGVTLDEAIAWDKFNTERRYEWLEILSHAFGFSKEDNKPKPCRDSRACVICRKPCSQRLAAANIH